MKKLSQNNLCPSKDFDQALPECKLEVLHLRQFTQLKTTAVYHPLNQNRLITAVLYKLTFHMSVTYITYDTLIILQSYLFFKPHINAYIIFLRLSIIFFLSKTPACFYLNTQCFIDWILSPSSGKIY
jgi:hypothetical protein